MNHIKNLLQLIRFDKPIGTFLLLWPCLIALVTASNPSFPEIRTLIIFTAGVFLMRSAGCAINDIADRKIDIFVKRTKDRPLAANKVSLLSAIIFFIILSSLSACLAFLLKPGTLVLAIGAFATAVLYPWMKRFTNYPQVVLSIAFCWSIPMSYYEVQGQIPYSAFVLWLSMCFWVIAYDTTYAMVDKDDDIKIGVHSTAIAFGDNEPFAIHLLQTVSMILFLIFGYINNFNIFFYVINTAAYGLFFLNYIDVATKKRQQCFAAFLRNNSIGMLMFWSVFMGTPQI